MNGARGERIRLAAAGVGAWLRDGLGGVRGLVPAPMAHRARHDLDAWTWATVLLSVVILVPLATALSGVASPGPHWRHLAETVLGGYVANTLILVVAVSGLSLVMAIPGAWLVSVFEFPGRRFFEWGLILPLALPTYVAAFAYFDVPEAAIPFLIEVRKQFGFGAFQAAEAGLRYGVLAVVMASVLFPYLFLTARATFGQQGRAMIEAAQTLGRGPFDTFRTVALPLARPAIVAGLSLIVMEVINDYGAVHFFGVPTLTEGIFRTWFGLGDRASALRISGFMMLAIWGVLFMENHLRGRARFAERAHSLHPLVRRRLGGWKGIVAAGACGLPFALGFVVPVWKLLGWAVVSVERVVDGGFARELANTLGLALGTALGLTAVAVLFAYARKLHPVPWLGNLGRFATLGYATPGAVVAVGVMVSLGVLDRAVVGAGASGPWFSGTLAAIGFAYLVRFLAVPAQPVEAGLTRICGSLDEASRTLGHAPLGTLWRINLPILRGTLWAAVMLVFVDVMKELPLTMILRPANFETLATSAFGLAKEGRIQECAVPSLVIVAAGTAGLVVLNRFMRRVSP